MEDPRDFTIFSELVVKLLDDSKGDIETALNPPSLTSEPNIINQYPWLKNMLEVVIQNSLRLATFGKVKSRTPEQVSNEEAKLLGRQLSPFLPGVLFLTYLTLTRAGQHRRGEAPGTSACSLPTFLDDSQDRS